VARRYFVLAWSRPMCQRCISVAMTKVKTI